MFFGISSFNFTRANDKKFHVDTTNYANLDILCTFTDASIYHISFVNFLFANRECPPVANKYFYKSTNPSMDSCVSVCPGDKQFQRNDYFLCMPCHYTCLTCYDIGEQLCLTCSLTYKRTPQLMTIIGAISLYKCLCLSTYFDNGYEPTCTLCSSVIIGC